MRLGTGAARTLVLAAWAALFAVLWAADEGQRYLGPRTQWVIPFGALALGAVFRDERVTALAVGGALLVVAGIGVAQLPLRRVAR